MSDFDRLPRDVQLEIIKRFDIDARVKCGIIGKLKIPQRVERLIAERAKKLTIAKHQSHIFLGTPMRYHLTYQESKRCWDVFHITLEGAIRYYWLDERANRWTVLGDQGI